MGYKFIYIESRNSISQHTSTIIEVFSAILNIEKYEVKEKHIILYSFNSYIASISDLISNLVEDLYVDFRVYESRTYKDQELLIDDINYVEHVIPLIPFSRYNYLNNKTLLAFHLNDITSNLKKIVLGTYYNNQEMIKTIKEFLEHNQNTTSASKALYIHRNTLNQRLDKFEQETDFNVKTFNDAFLIYHLMI